MDHSLLRNFMHWDDILSFRKLEGEPLHELWWRFNSLLMQCQTSEIRVQNFWNASTEVMVLKIEECLINSFQVVWYNNPMKKKPISLITWLGSIRRQKGPRLFWTVGLAGPLIRKGHGARSNYQRKYRYNPHHMRRRKKKQSGGHIVEELFLIHHKVEENDRVLKEIKENVLTEPYDNLSFHVHLSTRVPNGLSVVFSLPKATKRVALWQWGKLQKWNLSGTCVVPWR